MGINKKCTKQRIKFDYEEYNLPYFKDLKKYKPLKKDEERKLLEQYKNENDIVARQKLITSNLRYACSLVNKYTGNGVSVADLIEEANCGLIEAIDRYDLKNKVKVITYAKWYIIEKMQNSINKSNRLDVEFLPEDYEIKINNVNPTIQENNNDLLNNASIDDDILENHKKEDNIEKIISTSMSVLNDKERDFIEMYYGLGDYKETNTYEEIGKKYNISKERTRQIIDKTLRKMRVEVLKTF